MQLIQLIKFKFESFNIPEKYFIYVLVLTDINRATMSYQFVNNTTLSDHHLQEQQSDMITGSRQTSYSKLNNIKGMELIQLIKSKFESFF